MRRCNSAIQSPSSSCSFVHRSKRGHSARLASLSLALLLGACGGSSGDGGTQPTGSNGSLSLSLAPSAVTVAIGGSGSVSLSVTRAGTFTGPVTLAVTGLPAGVTGVFSSATIASTATASTLTLSAAASASAVTTTVTVSASGSGVTTQTSTVQLTVAPPGTITLGAVPASLTIAAGQSGTSTISVTRSTGFTGAVALVLDSPPAGITGAFTPSSVTGATSALVVSVAATVPAGSYSLVVRGSSPGAADRTVTVTVVVTTAQPVGFSVSVDPVEFELPAGRPWDINGIVNITRLNGFTGPVTVTVTPLVGTFTSTIGASPGTIAANATATNLLALNAADTPAGVYTATVRVSGAGVGDQSTQVRLRVSAPSTGTIAWKFCNASRVPKYFAVRDGSGAWKHIVPSGPETATAANPTVYSFSVTSPTAAIAIVSLGGKTSASPLVEGFDWRVYYMTAQEIADQAALECVRYPDVPSRTASTTVTGYKSFEAVLATASSYALANTGSTGPFSTSISVSNIQPGPFDLLTTRSTFLAVLQPIAVQSLVLQRALNPAAGGTFAPVNFATDGVSPAVGTVTFGNAGGETFSTAQTFMTAAGLNGLLAATAGYALTDRLWYGVPSDKLIAGDLHQIVATTGTTSARRAVIAYSRTVSTRTLDFGPALSAPSVTAGSGGASPWIVRATGTLSADYTARASLYLHENFADPRTMTIVASRGALGAGSAYDVAVPDLSAAAGSIAFWNFHRGISVAYTMTGGEGDAGGPNEAFCILIGICPVKAVDGAIYKSAQSTGTVTIP